MTKTNNAVVCIILMALFVCSCNRAWEQSSKSFPVEATVITTSTPSSAPMVMDATPKQQTLTPVFTSTISKTHLPTQGVSVTETLLAPLPAAEAEDKVIQLLSDNGNCRLPCFWDFSPQNINDQIVESFTHPFYNLGGQIIKLSRDNSIIEISIINQYIDETPNDDGWLYVGMKVYRKVDFGDGPFDELVFDNPYFTQYVKYYTLSSLLSNYGPPSAAFVGVDQAEPIGYDLYHLFLDYSEFGWAAHFVMPLKQENGYYIGCPTEAFIDLYLWSLENPAAAAIVRAGINDVGIYRPLEEATSIVDLEEFYHQFRNQKNTQCLKTLVDH